MSNIWELLGQRKVLKIELENNILLAKEVYRKKRNILENEIKKITEKGVKKRISQYVKR